MQDNATVPALTIQPTTKFLKAGAVFATLIFLGRMTASKRPAHVLEAFRILRRRRPDAQLWMVGDGPVRPQLQGRETAGVRFFGRVSDARRDVK